MEKLNDCKNCFSHPKLRGYDYCSPECIKGAIRFGSPNNKNDYLNNSYPSPIEFQVSDKMYTFNSVYHAFQALKFTNNKKHFIEILKLQDPKYIKMYVKHYKKEKNKDVFTGSLKRMEFLLRLKFCSDNKFGQYLISTSGKNLVYDHEIIYWGASQNMLGKILMKIREDLMKEKYRFIARRITALSKKYYLYY